MWACDIKQGNRGGIRHEKAQASHHSSEVPLSNALSRQTGVLPGLVLLLPSVSFHALMPWEQLTLNSAW